MKTSYKDILKQYIMATNADDLITCNQAARFVAQIKRSDDQGMVKKNVNVNMKRLEEAGLLVRLQKGVYARKVNTPFGAYVPGKEAVIAKLLTKEGDQLYGYETGLSLLNSLGLVSQMPKVRFIATNRYRRNIPNGLAVKVRKPVTLVNNKNAAYLQLLDAIRDMDKAPVDADDPARILRAFAAGNKLDINHVLIYVRDYYPKDILGQAVDVLLGSQR